MVNRMQTFFIVILAVVIIAMAIKMLSRKGDAPKDDGAKIEADKILPYKTRDDFLSSAEKSFYLTLKTFINEKAVICPKVSLKDIFFVSKSADNGVGKNYMKYFGYISQKHVDFLLCDPKSMKPLCGIELDDSSHAKEKRIARDEFVDRVYANAGLPLVHIPLKQGYSVDDLKGILDCLDGRPFEMSNDEIVKPIDTKTAPLCPKCGVSMLRRRSTKGDNVGKEFYGCPNYPRCHEMVPIEEAVNV
jgi:predicted RNA-binding Zn-ribbon protein involved in translation (DUF1610 family)